MVGIAKEVCEVLKEYMEFSSMARTSGKQKFAIRREDDPAAMVTKPGDAFKMLSKGFSASEFSLVKAQLKPEALQQVRTPYRSFFDGGMSGQ